VISIWTCRTISTTLYPEHARCRFAIYSCFEIGLKQQFSVAFTNSIAPEPIALESCSNPQNIRKVFESATKKFFGFGFQDFREWRHKWGRFLAILAHVTWPGAQLLDQRISLKFSLKTSLESESFEPLIDFQAFLVQKLGSEINKLINYLIKGLIDYFVYFRSYLFRLKPQKVIQISKDSDFSLVSNESLSEILPSNGWGPEPDEVGKSGLKALHFWRHSQKIRNTKPKNFFFIAN